MAFKKRTADRRKLEVPIFSGAAEVCETRALLSADGVCLPAVDADAVVIEDIEATESEEVMEVDASVEDGEFVPELAICTMMVPEFFGEVEVFGEEVADEEGEVLIAEENVDPSLMFYSFMSSEGGDIEVSDESEVAVCDIAPDEEVVVEEGETLVDEELVDPSLMLYSFVTSEGGYPEVAVCDGLVVEEEPVFKGDFEEEAVVDGEEPAEVTFDDFDPSWVIRSFGAPAGEVVDDLAFTSDVVDSEVVLDDVVEEEFVVDEEFVDVTTLEDYDPSWAYRTLSGVVTDDGEEVVDEVADGEVKVQFWHDLAPPSDEDVVVDETDGNVDITTLEDYDPSWAYRGSVVDGEKVLDEEESVVDEEETVVDEGAVIEEGELTEEEIVVLEDGSEIPVRYYFGMNFRGNTGGELPVEILSMTGGAPVTESAPTVMGPVAIATPVVNTVVSAPVVSQPVSMPPVVTPALAIPVTNGGPSTLFVEEEELLVNAFSPVVSEIEPLASEVEATVSPTLESAFGNLISSTSESFDAPVGELAPIFGDEQDEEDSVEVPAAEEVPVETEEPVSSVEVPQQPVVVASRANYGRSIDEFMSEFAMSGFAG
ncbi:MAG: hypothetical protein U0936_25220 [Planctomycetaceae bacterium]